MFQRFVVTRNCGWDCFFVNCCELDIYFNEKVNFGWAEPILVADLFKLEFCAKIKPAKIGCRKLIFRTGE
jgi:hypothetical protein